MTQPPSLTERFPDLIARLNAPAEVGADAGVTRYLLDLYRRREDLQRGYPDLHGPDGRRLVEWAYVHGRDEVPIPSELLPPGPREPADQGAGVGVNRYLHRLWSEREVLRRAFPDLDGEDGQRMVAWARTDGARDDPMLASLYVRGEGPGHEAVAPGAASRHGVNVVGCLRSQSGLGAAARAVIAGLDAAGVPLLPVAQELLEHEEWHPFAAVPASTATFPISLVCLNPRQLWHFRAEAPAEWFAGRYSIGLWWWELPDSLPIEWWTAFEVLDELWVGSETVASAVRGFPPVPVTRVRLPVIAPNPAPVSRRELGLPEGFLFLSLFDHESTFVRKNPLGAVEAFTAAFPQPGEAELVVKATHEERHPDAHERLRRAAAEHPHVHVLGGRLPVQLKDAMLAACDCFVSLHRAEGFGLPLAEAMCLGKPAVATGWGGNLEFMTQDNSFLVDHGMTRVGMEAAPYYDPDAEWAEPDLEHAAALMRRVYERPDEASAVGALGAEHLGREHAPEVAGRTLAGRLEELWKEGVTPREPGPLSARVAALRESLGAGPGALGPGGEGRLRALARRLVLRLARPYAYWRSELDRDLLDLLDELGRRTESDPRPLAETLASSRRHAGLG